MGIPEIRMEYLSVYLWEESIWMVETLLGNNIKVMLLTYFVVVGGGCNLLKIVSDGRLIW